MHVEAFAIQKLVAFWRQQKGAHRTAYDEQVAVLALRAAVRLQGDTPPDALRGLEGTDAQQLAALLERARAQEAEDARRNQMLGTWVVDESALPRDWTEARLAAERQKLPEPTGPQIVGWHRRTAAGLEFPEATGYELGVDSGASGGDVQVERHTVPVRWNGAAYEIDRAGIDALGAGPRDAIRVVPPGPGDATTSVFVTRGRR